MKSSLRRHTNRVHEALDKLGLVFAATTLVAAGCGGHVEPKAVVGIGPIECSIKLDLKLSCSVGRQWMLGLGPVRVGLGLDAFPGSHGALILLVKQPDGANDAWQVGQDDRPLCLHQNGNFTTRVGRNLLEITPEVGATIRITDPQQTGTGCTSQLGTSAPTASSQAAGSDVTVITLPGGASLSTPAAHGGGDPGGVSAQDDGGGGNQGGVVNSAPAAPSQVTADPVAPDTVRVAWRDNSNNETGFLIKSGDRVERTGADISAFNWTGLAQGSRLCVQVRAVRATASSSYAPSAPVCATTPTVPMTPPSYVYPSDGQTLGINGHYMFKVTAVAHASGYLFGFFQDGQLIWENFRDEGSLSGTEYSIASGTPAHDRFHAGPVDVWVRAHVYRVWTEPRIITITLS